MSRLRILVAIYLSGLTYCLANAQDGSGLIKEHLAIKNRMPADSVSFSGDGKTLAFSLENGEVILWNVSADKVLARLAAHFRVTVKPDPTVAFITGNTNTLVTQGYDHCIRIWDCETRKCQKTIEGVHPVHSVSLSPGGRYLAYMSKSKKDGLTVVTLGTSKVLLSSSLDVYPEVYLAIALSTHAKWVATAVAEQKGASILEVKTGKIIGEIKGHRRDVRCLAFSYNDNLLASASYDGTCRIWEVPSGKLRCILKGGDYGFASASFSPRGRVLAACDGKGCIWFWNIDDPKRKLVVQAHKSIVWSIAFSPDGKMLASAGDDGFVKVWQVEQALMTLLKPEIKKKPGHRE